MSLYTPAYRLTIYAADNVTPLTPAAGAVHANPFQVASVQGVTGYQPYLDLPKGRKGTYDPISGRVTIGSLTFRLLDMRTGSGNLARWMTAFLGDAAGKFVLKGKKVVVEEALDWNGSTGTFNPFYVGRVTGVALDNPLFYALTISEATDELDLPCFVGRPAGTATNSAVLAVLPVGLSANYGPYITDAALSGTLGPSPNWLAQRRLTLTPESYAATSNHLRHTVNLTGPVYYSVYATTPSSDYRLRLTSGGLSAEYRIVGYDANYFTDFSRVLALDFAGFDETLMNSGSTIGLFPSSSTVSFNVVPNTQVVSKDNPLLISDIHPAQLMKDMAQGLYGYLDINQQPLRGMTVDTTAFATLLADATFPNARFAIEKESKTSDFIEKQLGPFGLGYRVEPRSVSGSITAVFVPFDTRLPSSLVGLPAVTNADVANMGTAKWTLGNSLTAITLTTYKERYAPYRPQTGDVPEVLPTLENVANQTIFLRPEALNSGLDTLAVDVQGVRESVGEDPANPMDIIIASNLAADTAKKTILSHLDNRFGFGPPVAELSCRRTATISGLQIGTWCTVTVDVLPDPATNLRGGTRLMQVVERSENGPTVTLRLMDAGVNVNTPAPIVTAPSFINNGFSINASGSVNARLNIQVATTALGGARPADSASVWVTRAATVINTTGSVPYFVQQTPWGFTYHVRARSEGVPGYQPSAWANASSASVFVPNGPTSVSASNLTGTTATITWANPVLSASVVEIAVASPTGSTYTVVESLPESSTGYVLTGLSSGSASNPYGVRVRYADGLGSYSSGSTTVFSINAPQPKCPSLSAFYAVTTTL